MKLIAFILALLAGATSLVVFNQVKREDVPMTPRLVANIGMPIDEVRRRSTPDVVGEGVYFARRHDGSSEDQYRADTRDRAFYREDPFDWEVAGTSLRFAGCRYFNIKTGEKDDPRLVYMWVTTAQKKLTYDELKAEMLAIQERILADGWKPIIYRDDRASDEALRQNLALTPTLDTLGKYKGVVAYYLKDEVVICFLGLQLGSFQEGSDPFGQANFYHRMELEPRAKFERGWGRSIITR